jgi:hypothetical protein
MNDELPTAQVVLWLTARTLSSGYRSVTLRSLLTNALEYERMYIDPTTGSLVLQFLAAGVLSVLAMVSRVREAVKHFFKLLVPRRGKWAGKP